MAIKTSLAVALAFAATHAWAEHISVPLAKHAGTDDATVNSHRHQHLLAKAMGNKPATIVPETWHSHTFWYGNWTVGASTLRLAIDTGSPLVVTDPGLYKPSSAGVNTNQTGNIPYVGVKPDACGSYVAYYDQWNDTVSVENIIVKAQPVFDTHKHPSPQPGEITALPPPFQGIVGFSGLSKGDYSPYLWFPEACKAGQVAECRFGVAYGTSSKGVQVLGGIDDSLFSGSLSYSKLYQGQRWAIPGPVYVKGKRIGGKPQNVVLDTGTPNVQGPIAQVKQIFTKLGLQMESRTQPACAGGTVVFGYYPCDSPPDITWAVGGKQFAVNPNAAYLHKNGNNCTSTLVGVDYGKGESNFWLLGQAWMQGKYLDMDLTGGQVGVAVLKDPTGGQ